MGTGRLEAFSDGVLAIIITIMVLELPEPGGSRWSDFVDDTLTGLVIYLLSFVYVGIYWSNHHHMLQLSGRVTGGVLWANLHLLFWLSLFPFTTKWVGESDLARTPVLVYGVNLLLAGLAYYLLERTLISTQGSESPLRKAVGRDPKGLASPPIYVLGIAAVFITPWLSMALFAVVALMWLVPDRRVERFAEQIGISDLPS